MDLFQLTGFQNGKLIFLLLKREPRSKLKVSAHSLEKAAASTSCLGSALSRCSEAATGTGDYCASHLGGLCSGAREYERAKCPDVSQFAPVSSVALSSVEMSRLFVSWEERAYRPNCLNPSFGHLIP